MKQTITRSGLRWIWVAVLVIGLDQLTKIMIQHSFGLYDSLRLTPFFNLTLAYNTGAAFSFLDSASGWQAWFFGAIAIAVCVSLVVWSLRLSYRQRWLSIALMLIIGGAVGNLCDRVLYSHVIDFIQVHIGHLYWPVFNVADSAICIGAFMLAIDTLFNRA